MKNPVRLSAGLMALLCLPIVSLAGSITPTSLAVREAYYADWSSDPYYEDLRPLTSTRPFVVTDYRDPRAPSGYTIDAAMAFAAVEPAPVLRISLASVVVNGAVWHHAIRLRITGYQSGPTVSLDDFHRAAVFDDTCLIPLGEYGSYPLVVSLPVPYVSSYLGVRIALFESGAAMGPPEVTIARVLLTDPSTIPEPSSVILMVIGFSASLAAFGHMRRVRMR